MDSFISHINVQYFPSLDINIIASGLAGRKISSAETRAYNAEGGAEGLTSVGLKHCSHCKGLRGPCLCEQECPIPNNNLWKSQCFPVDKRTYCDACGTQNFQGNRFTCQECSDFDLCQPCYEGGRHDIAHPFYHIATLGRSSVLLEPRSKTSAASSVLLEHRSNASAATSVPGSSSSHQNFSSVSSASSSSSKQHKTSTHGRSHAFALIGTEGAAPILLAKPRTADEHDAMEAQRRTNNIPEPHFYSSDARRQNFQPGSSIQPSRCYAKGPSTRSDDGVDCRPPNLMTSSCSFSSPLSSQNANHRLNQPSAETSSFCEMSSSKFSGHQSSSEPMPYVSGCWRGSEVGTAKHAFSAAQGNATFHSRLPILPNRYGENEINLLHRNAFCAGPKCRRTTQCIVGHRYTCANCPPSVDLCEECYSSQSAHDTSHSFKRFDESSSSGYVMCPPQQITSEEHSNLFFDRPVFGGTTTKPEQYHTMSNSDISTKNSTGRESARFGNPQMPTSNASNMNAFQELKCSPRASVDTHNCNRNEKSKAGCSAPARRPYLRRTSSGSDGADVTRPYRVPSRSSQLSSFSSPQPEHMVNLSASIPRKAACQSTTGANSDEDFSTFPPPSQTTLLPVVQQSVTLPTEQRITIPTAQSITLPTAEAILIPATESILLPTAEGILLPTAHPESWAYYEDDVNKSIDIFPVYQHGAAAPHARYRIVFCDGPMCRWETEGIVGPRFTCAECPSSVDLCEACYTSQTAHDCFHAFKRFDQPHVTAYTMCPPQQTRPEQHSNVFCDGPMCRRATQCIVGPRYMCANCPPTVDLCEGCYASQAAHDTTHAFKRFDKPGIKAHTMCPPQQQEQQQLQATPGQPSRVLCDGPRCREATHGIVGPRFTCTECPSSVDLCEACYTSQTAHDPCHTFKRFDRADTTTYSICPPQQTRPERHSNVFCSGPMCRWATQCIVGPRYVCANCPPFVDLCQRCYLSRDAHNPSHSFKRFDRAGVPAYVLCPPSGGVGSSSVADDGLLTFARDSLVDYAASTFQPLQGNRIEEPCLNPCIADHDTTSQGGSYWV